MGTMTPLFKIDDDLYINVHKIHWIKPSTEIENESIICMEDGSSTYSVYVSMDIRQLIDRINHHITISKC